MAQQNEISKLLETIDSCLPSNIDDLVLNSNWGNINFEISRPSVQVMVQLLTSLKNLPIELIPDNIFYEIQQITQGVSGTLQQMKAFTIDQGDPRGVRDAVNNQLKQQVDALTVVLAPWIPYLAYQQGDIQKNISKLRETLTQAETMIANAKNEIASKAEEIDEIIIVAREASATAGAAHFTQDFAKEAESFESSAGSWLITTCVFAVATIASLLAFLYFYTLPSEATSAQIFQYATSKFVIVGLLFAATAWCGKLYKSSKHQASINKHRANALKTFQAFTKAAGDDDTRNAVLLETTRSIFALAASGYLDEAGKSAESHVNVVDVLRRIPPTQGLKEG